MGGASSAGPASSPSLVPTILDNAGSWRSRQVSPASGSRQDGVRQVPRPPGGVLQPAAIPHGRPAEVHIQDGPGRPSIPVPSRFCGPYGRAAPDAPGPWKAGSRPGSRIPAGPSPLDRPRPTPYLISKVSACSSHGFTCAHFGCALYFPELGVYFHSNGRVPELRLDRTGLGKFFVNIRNPVGMIICLSLLE